MATYTITVNERTKAGKGLVFYLKSLGVIKEENEPNDTTLKAINEIKNGEVTRCKTDDGELHILNLIRTGTHSDLFKK